MNAAGSSAPGLAPAETHAALGDQWRALRRAATFVALLTTPALFLWLHVHAGISIGWSIVATALAAMAFRGGMDLVFRRFIPWPSLFGTDNLRLAEDDVLNRRRAWFWRQRYRLAIGIALLFVGVWVQLAVRDHPRLGVRTDVHGRRGTERPVASAQG